VSPATHETFLTPAEAAEIAGVSRKTLTRWESEGKIQAIRTGGGRRRYRQSELLQLVARGAAPGRVRAVAVEPVAPTRPTRASERRRALEALHASDVTGVEPDLAGARPYTRTLVEGVRAHLTELDQVIARAAEHWPLERMPTVDRNVLRVGVYELLHTDTPTGAVVDQAVSLAKLLSTEESGRFVNGVLGRIAREVR
jgi:N utilization substance protein B